MTIYNDITLLEPKFQGAVKRLHDYLIDSHETGRTKTRFEIFETFRDPMRQRELLAKKVSKAGPFESAHQFGLAVDFVPYLTPEEALALGTKLGEKVLPGWNWSATNDFQYLASAAVKFGLQAPISWDPCHIQHPSFEKLRQAWRTYIA